MFPQIPFQLLRIEAGWDLGKVYESYRASGQKPLQVPKVVVRP